MTKFCRNRCASEALRLTLVFSALSLLALTGCNKTAEQPFDNTLYRSIGAEPESLDIHTARSTQSSVVLRDLGEGLTGYSASGVVVAAGAESWQVSANGLEYRFQLRTAARWSNGEPVIAEHYVYSMRRMVNPDTAAAYAEFVNEIKNARAILSGDLPPQSLGIEAASDFELVITLERPVPYFLSLLTHNSTFPIYPPSVEAHGAEYARPGNMISNGAYTLDDWKIGSAISINRNPYYWNNVSTSIDRVLHLVTPEPTAEANRFRAGELDITDTVPTESFAQLREEYPEQLRVAPFLNVYYYGLNLTKPPLRGNPELRRALSMAIDREVIVDKVMGRGELPAYSWVPPGVDNYQAMQFSYANQPHEERVATARRLYEEAGYSTSKPLEIEIRYNTSDVHQRVALAVQAMWREALGFEAKLINEDFQVLLANILAREVTQVFRSAWNGEYNDASAFLSVMESGNASNLPGYNSEEFDSLMTRAADQMNPRHRRLFLEEAERELLSDHPVIPIYFYVSKHLVSSRVQGWQDNPLDYHYSQHLSLIPRQAN